MIAIDPRQLSGLEWKQPAAFSRAYELRLGDSVLGTLQFMKMLGSLAEAEVVGGKWTFKRTGFLSPKVTARVAGSEQDVALYEPNWTGTKGIFHLQGGELLDFRAKNMWASEWLLVDGRGQEILKYTTKGLWKSGASLHTGPALRERPDLAFLIMLTWYVLVLHIEDGSAVAATSGD